MNYKIHRDSMGEVRVEEGRYWGAQTQRSLENFRIGTEKMPREVIFAIAALKQAAARVNRSLGLLEENMAETIEQVCGEILEGKMNSEFPLSVWQTGSGTQTNMNVNEVIANRGNELLGREVIHPNDHVNRSQSSNDVFPSAMHIAAVLGMEGLIVELDRLAQEFRKLEKKYEQIIKIGRTHLQDATPLRFSQEISAWRFMIKRSEDMIFSGLDKLRCLAIGGTAVGTGLNAPKGFDRLMAEEVSAICKTRFEASENKFHALSSRDEIAFAHSALKVLAADLLKIANDIRWLSSGPRCGLGEIYIPENEPGSSIMPGKVNPTQCEALSMVCVQVMANDTAVSFAASQGNFQLNVYMPLCIYNFLQSLRLLTDAVRSFNENCVKGIRPNEKRIKENLERSLMLVTALSPRIGYDNAAKAAKKALDEDITLKRAAVELGFVSEEEFDELVRPENMVGLVVTHAARYCSPMQPREGKSDE